VVTAIMSKLALVAPKWKIVPTKDIIETGFKEPAKREEVSALDKPPGRSAGCQYPAPISVCSRFS
jgi:hypothetical protein